MLVEVAVRRVAVRHTLNHHMAGVSRTLVARVRLTPVVEAEFMCRRSPRRVNLLLVLDTNRPSIARRHSVNRTLANIPES